MLSLRIAAFCIFAVFASVYPAAAAENDLRACVGEICVRPRLSLEKDVISVYGPGVVVRGGKSALEDDRARCYFDKSWNAYVLVTFWHAHSKQMRVSGVFVSTEPLCKLPAPAAKAFSSVQLRSPISLGDAESLVVKKMGVPQREDKPKELETRNPDLVNEPGYGSKYGEKKWVYFPEGEDSLLGWSIHLEDGKVKSIGLWDAP